MRLARYVFAAVLAFAAPALAQPQPSTAPGPERFAPEIEAFAAADRAQPPKPCGVLFVGSSSIRFWKTLAADMAPYAVVNRGFGGSTIADVNYYFGQVVAPYRPRAIVFYAGENDLAAGKTPAAVAADFDRFMNLKTAALGPAPVYFITAKPSKLRFAQLDRQKALNDAVRAMAARRGDLQVIDVVGAMLQDGKPKDIYVADGLHMTPDGYAIWTRLVRPVVEREANRAAACKP
jgi:lysophospholipase L1-like esterase